jgi:CRP-like cAMP-binding protein
MEKIINSECYKFKKGHVLYEDGNPIKGKSIFLVKSGKVDIIYKLKNEKELKITIPEGGIFGAFECFSNINYRISKAVITEDSVICLWGKADFLMEASMSPELGLKTIAFLSSFLRTLNQIVANIG